ncbi:Sorbitol dehydrogenase [compost metagenome]
MAMMKAARLHEIGGKFSIDEVPQPQPGPHDVLVKVEASGIIPNLKNVTTHFPEWYPFLPLPRLPATFGLDSAGTVVAVGSAVTSFKPGERVYVNPGVGCGECRFCRQGEAPRCDAYTFLGYFGFGPGSQAIFEKYPYAGYGQYMTAPVTSLVRLPSNLGSAQATRLGYLGTAYSAIRKSALRPGQSILILGASGTLGVGAALLALAFGASRVLVAARDRAALERLTALAPQRVIGLPIGSQPVSEQVRELCPGGVDVMLDTLGAKAPAELSVDAMTAVARGGRIVQIGGVAGPIPIDPHPFMCAQLQYLGSLWFTTAEGNEMAAMIESGLLDLSLLEERAYPLGRLNEALDDIQTQANGFTNFHIVHE